MEESSFFDDAFDTTGEAAARERVLYPGTLEEPEVVVDLTTSDHGDGPGVDPTQNDAQLEDNEPEQEGPTEGLANDHTTGQAAVQPQQSAAVHAAIGVPTALLTGAAALTAATPTATPAATFPASTTTAPKPKGPKFIWNYKNKFFLNLVMDATLPTPANKAEKEELFNAMIQKDLTDLGFQQSYPYKNMDAQYRQKKRTGIPGNPGWTDADWNRIKDNQGDARDKAWRGAIATAVHATAHQLSIAMV